MRIPEYDDGYDSAASFEAAGADRLEDMEPDEPTDTGHLPKAEGQPYSYAPRRRDGPYLECTNEYLANNLELAEWLLDQYGMQWHGRCEE